MGRINIKQHRGRHLLEIAERYRDHYLFLLHNSSDVHPKRMMDIPSLGLDAEGRKRLGSMLAVSAELGLLNRIDEGRPAYWVRDPEAIAVALNNTERIADSINDVAAPSGIDDALAPLFSFIVTNIESRIAPILDDCMCRFMKAIQVQIDEEVLRGKDEVAKAVAGAIASLNEEAKKLCLSAAQPMVEHSAPPKEKQEDKEEKKRLVRVCVVGLLPSQISFAKDGFDECLDLRFYSADTTAQQLSSAFAECDAAVVMTKFVSHLVTNVAKKAPRHELCNGGISSLRDVLTKIYVDSDKRRAA